MDFDSHASRVVSTAVALVNDLTDGASGGRPFRVADEVAAARTAVAHTRSARSAPQMDEATASRLVTLARQLRGVFERVQDGDRDGAARAVNRLLQEYRAMPELARHDGEAWHLHFHSSRAGLAEGLGAGCATALAVVLGGEHADRLGVCSADGCDRVFVDTSRNGSRRFCSTACQNRVKAAAFRARQRG